ncbi:MAG: UPF0262 family protein [Alphaproteobacteria bacterium]
MKETTAKQDSSFRICRIALDEHSLSRRTHEIGRERDIAIRDLLEGNYFRPRGSQRGPYHLELAIAENKLVIAIGLKRGDLHGRIMLSLTPFRRVVKEYFQVCESYYAAVRDGRGAQVEAIDMGRRGLHNDGARLLRERLKGKIEMDFNTARRLFTLLCVLHVKR